jgi:hypothetical protein
MTGTKLGTGIAVVVLTGVTNSLANALDNEATDDVAVPVSGCSELGFLDDCSRNENRYERSSEDDESAPLEDKDGGSSDEDERVSRAYEGVSFNVLGIADKEELGSTLGLEIGVGVGVTFEVSGWVVVVASQWPDDHTFMVLSLSTLCINNLSQS